LSEAQRLAREHSHQEIDDGHLAPAFMDQGASLLLTPCQPDVPLPGGDSPEIPADQQMNMADELFIIPDEEFGMQAEELSMKPE